MAAGLTAALLIAGCAGNGEHAALTPAELNESIRRIGSPALVVLWADWSRPAVELLPTVGELASEFEGQGVAILVVSLGEPAEGDVGGILAGLPETVRRLSLAGEPTSILARYEIQDVPAALGYGPDGRHAFTLQSEAHAPLTPADLADAIESLSELAPSGP